MTHDELAQNDIRIIQGTCQICSRQHDWHNIICQQLLTEFGDGWSRPPGLPGDHPVWAKSRKLWAAHHTTVVCLQGSEDEIQICLEHWREIGDLLEANHGKGTANEHPQEDPPEDGPHAPKADHPGPA